jgi:hypothetical protein
MAAVSGPARSVPSLRSLRGLGDVAVADRAARCSSTASASASNDHRRAEQVLAMPPSPDSKRTRSIARRPSAVLVPVVNRLGLLGVRTRSDRAADDVDAAFELFEALVRRSRRRVVVGDEPLVAAVEAASIAWACSTSTRSTSATSPRTKLELRVALAEDRLSRLR